MMLKRKKIITIMMLSAAAMTVQAAGFDCRKAKTFVEKAICQDITLSALDEELVSAYNSAIANSKNPKALKKQQLNWLKSKRNVCQTNQCLEQVYKERIVVLKNSAESGSMSVSHYVRYDSNNQPDYHTASLTLYMLKGKVKITGSAIWVGDSAMGNIHTGEVEGIFNLQGEQIHYQDQSGCDFMILMGKNALTVNNDNGQCGGANVTFNGYYKKK